LAYMITFILSVEKGWEVSDPMHWVQDTDQLADSCACGKEYSGPAKGVEV
jgi:hypothetical protein